MTEQQISAAEQAIKAQVLAAFDDANEAKAKQAMAGLVAMFLVNVQRIADAVEQPLELVEADPKG